MELWEFNNYMLGVREKSLTEQENIVRLAYTTASFSNMKKPKPLQHYLDKLRSDTKGGTVKVAPNTKRLDEVEAKIEMLKSQSK